MMSRPARIEVADARDRLAIARILKVNHAGEYGAIRIYRAQIWVARRLFPDVVAFLEETLGHEINHCAMFRNAMPARGARPCRATVLWGNGGLILGFLTALMGREGIWICTAAVEGTVHKHLDDQLFFLRGKDPELHALIDAIQAEELHHLNYCPGAHRIAVPVGAGAQRAHFRGDRYRHLAVDLGRFDQNGEGPCRRTIAE